MVKAEVFGPGTYDSCAHRVKRLTGVLLIFHPGCGHCVQMRSEWEAMKQRLPQGSKVVEVDGSALSDHPLRNMAPFQQMEGFPTILKMKNGKPVAQFRGQRTKEEMAQFSRPTAQFSNTSAQFSRPSAQFSRSNSKSKSKSRRRPRKRKIDTRKKRS